MVVFTLGDEHLAELRRAAEEGSPVARGALALDDDTDEEACLAWRAYYLAARRMGHLDLARRVRPALETCPACGARAFAEHAFGIGELGENHAWVLLLLCLGCGHEGELRVDTGDPLG